MFMEIWRGVTAEFGERIPDTEVQLVLLKLAYMMRDKFQRRKTLISEKGFQRSDHVWNKTSKSIFYG